MLSRLYTIRPCLIQSARCIRPFSSSSINNNDNPNFFDIKPTFKNKNSAKKIHDNDARDFMSLLDSLFDTHTPERSPKQEVKQDPNQQFQDQLMEFILNPKNQQPVYKPTSPLPKNLATMVFDDSASIDHEETRKVTGLANDERIKEKEQENKVIDAILSSKTELELLKAVSEEINQDTYPRYYPQILVKAMEHATFYFKDPYLAITIFERAKQKSLTSYIAGCNTHAYNTILKVRWDMFRDVYGVLETLEEMTLNGIKCNYESREIVSTMNVDDSLFWNKDERRASNMMKELVAKWKVR